jgi:tRNA(Ile)-lysidine synthase
MALLALLRRHLGPGSLLAAHLDHGLRPGSAAEAQRAGEMAGRLGLECRTARVEVGLLARERGKGIEEAARAARYDFLLSILSCWPGDHVVTAHQAEDQAETIIMKLARGGGPGALVGIRAVSGPVLRPLLGFGRDELRGYLRARGLGWLEDPSNADQRFGRNLVRREILPQLGRLNPAFLAAFGRASGLAACEEEFWDRHLDGLLERLGYREDGDWLGVLGQGLAGLGLAEARRVCGRLLRRVGPRRPGGGEPVSLASADMILGIAGTPGGGGLDLPGGRRAEWRGQYLYVGPASRYGRGSGA